MNFRRIAATVLAVLTFSVSLQGCDTKSVSNKNGGSNKVRIVISPCPDKNDTNYPEYEKRFTDFMKQYPNIEISGESYLYNVDTFNAKSAAKQMPTLFSTWFTQVDSIVEAGYATDLTDNMDKSGFTQAMNPDLLEFVTDENGKIFGIPWNTYAQGLYINKKMFKEAGLVDASGNVLIPDTYEQVADYAKIIKEKTGKAGFVFPTVTNNGGWMFMNIAWSNGVEFAKKNSDGKYQASFNTPECVDAFQFLYDLKWKYNTIPTESSVDQDVMRKIFATNQAAMMISAPPNNMLVQTFGMNKDDIVAARIPKGKAGRFSQMGGDLYMVSSTATPDQVDACFKWLEFTGFSPNLTDESIEKIKADYQNTLDKKGMVLPKTALPIWINEDRVKKWDEITAQYTNVNAKDYESYFAFEGVTIRPEVPVACQELYATLDKCIQEIFANKNVDISALVAKSESDWQQNYLNNLK